MNCFSTLVAVKRVGRLKMRQHKMEFNISQMTGQNLLPTADKTKRDLRPSGILPSAVWKFCTDVSGQPVSPGPQPTTLFL
jgi:hypothetical protein